ncbi:MAG TPA: cupredoxin domain-containing protein [Actinomycetota bacterium]|nr:cupredoxin domain-containing protein [Actinomycetota bacterium]
MNIKRKLLIAAAGLGMVAFVGTSCAVKTAQAAAPAYTQQHFDYSIVAVPQLVHEQAATFGYLKRAFAKHGLLDGKEVWGWSINHITVYQGDSVTANLLNPGDDPHTFTISELAVNKVLNPGASTSVTFSAYKLGTFKFFCAMPEHMPYMTGTITVLPDSAAS